MISPDQSETIALLQDRASVRKFSPAPVDDQLLRHLLAIATRAPTSFNFQGYALVVTREAERIASLAELTGKNFLRDAPVFVLVCADFARLWELGTRHGEPVGPEHDDLTLSAVIDASLVGMTLALGAESVGLGTVMVGAVRNKPAEIATLFGLPSGVHALFGVTLGWPDVRPEPRPRLHLDLVVHRETYQPHGADPALWKPRGAVTARDEHQWTEQIVRGLRVAQKRSSPQSGFRLFP